MINGDNGIGVNEHEICQWIIEKRSFLYETWPKKTGVKQFSSFRAYYKTEDEYAQFAWEQFILGHKIWKVVHLKDCVRVIIELYGRKIRREWVK